MYGGASIHAEIDQPTASESCSLGRRRLVTVTRRDIGPMRAGDGARGAVPASDRAVQALDRAVQALDRGGQALDRRANAWTDRTSSHRAVQALDRTMQVLDRGVRALDRGDTPWTVARRLGPSGTSVGPRGDRRARHAPRAEACALYLPRWFIDAYVRIRFSLSLRIAMGDLSNGTWRGSSTIPATLCALAAVGKAAGRSIAHRSSIAPHAPRNGRCLAGRSTAERRSTRGTARRTSVRPRRGSPLDEAFTDGGTSGHSWFRASAGAPFEEVF
jgi:hypothetical protein